ncbi:MAG TPA: hypothetical protein VN133_11560 [Humibacter sp.]|jgi:hypothetical protein|nr:hypothetical protein [Humibacter sp.]
MSDKSPKKTTSKTAAAKTLKEKRADKRAKATNKAGSDLTDALGKHR